MPYIDAALAGKDSAIPDGAETTPRANCKDEDDVNSTMIQSQTMATYAKTSSGQYTSRVGAAEIQP